jgi:outer membrane cobalamin receptor
MTVSDRDRERRPHSHARALAGGIATAACLLFNAQPSRAQDVTLPPVDVVASPIIESVPVDSFSGSSARIGADQIRDQNSIDLPSAMRNTPGTEISRFNPVGSYAGDQGGRVFIHGLGAGAPGAEIQTYFDGVPLYSPVWGHPLLDTLPIGGIAAIDIFKGPRPWINGNNWGSIDLTTTRPTQDGLHGDGQLSGGMFGTVMEQANLYGRSGAVDFSLSESFARSNGSRANAEGQIGDIHGRVGVQLDDHWRADLSFLYVNSIAHDPQPNSIPAVPVTPHYDTQLGLAALSLSHKYDSVSGEVKIYLTDADSRWRDTTYALAPIVSNVYNAEYKFQTLGVRWNEQVVAWSGGTVEMGMDYDQIQGHNTTQAPFPTPVNIDSPTFQLFSPRIAVRQDIPLTGTWKLVPSAGLRLYAHSVFPTEVAPHAGVSLVSDKLTVYALYARGVHYPSLEVFEFSQLYPFFGNTWRSLSAERDEHGEIGFKADPFEGTRIDFNVFSDWVSKRYVFNFATASDINFGAYRSQGMELSVRQNLGPDWSVFAGWTILTASEALLPFMPHDTVALGVNGRIGPVKLAVDAQYRSWIWGLTDFRVPAPGPGSEQKVDPFFVANIRLSYPVPALGQKGEVFLAVENLFDRHYSYAPGYPQPGTWAQVGVKASF